MQNELFNPIHIRLPGADASNSGVAGATVISMDCMVSLKQVNESMMIFVYKKTNNHLTQYLASNGMATLRWASDNDGAAYEPT